MNRRGTSTHVLTRTAQRWSSDYMVAAPMPGSVTKIQQHVFLFFFLMIGQDFGFSTKQHTSSPFSAVSLMTLWKFVRGLDTKKY